MQYNSVTFCKSGQNPKSGQNFVISRISTGARIWHSPTNYVEKNIHWKTWHLHTSTSGKLHTGYIL